MEMAQHKYAKVYKALPNSQTLLLELFEMLDQYQTPLTREQWIVRYCVFQKLEEVMGVDEFDKYTDEKYSK